VGGIGFSGPTTGDVAAVYWNPAALSLIHDAQIQVTATFRRDRARIQRSAVDPQTGLPSAAGDPIPATVGNGDIAGSDWPPGPGAFMGFAIDVQNRFTLALAAYTPAFQRISFAAEDGTAPSRYHAVDVDLRNFALVPALAFRVGERFSVGAAPGFLFPNGRLRFSRDAALSRGDRATFCGGGPCGAENPEAAVGYDLDGGRGPLNGSLAVTVAFGFLFQAESWSLGASYSSRPLGRPNGGVQLDLNNGTVTVPAGLSGAPPCPTGVNPDQGDCLSGELAYRLPDTFIVGGTWWFKPRWSLTGVLRYLTFSRHKDLTIGLSGPAGSNLGQPGAPARFVVRRGFRNLTEFRLRLTHILPLGIQVGTGLRLTSGAVPTNNVTPAAFDGLTLEPSLMASHRLAWVTLSVGYGLSIIPRFSVSNSAFSPAFERDCVDSGRNLSTVACGRARAGLGLPSAAGRYSRLAHLFSFSATAHF